MGDCSDCADSNCAYAVCDDLLSTCGSNSDCFDLQDCIIDCGSDPDCQVGCHDTYANGVADYYSVLNCLYCSESTCSEDCLGNCPIEPPPDAGCDAASCNACVADYCPWFWCGQELDACDADDDCDAYETCINACSTPQCEYDCGASNTTGRDLYYAIFDCVYCSQDACGTDCDAEGYCPVEPPPAPGCDAASCTACVSDYCPWFWCGGALDACDADAACANYETCIDACSTPQCEYDCGVSNATGRDLYYAVFDCVYCDATACGTDCDAEGYCPVEPPPAPGCDAASCTACVQDYCPWFWCGEVLDACDANAACANYETCINACSTPQCEYDCGASNTTGRDLYYAVFQCVYCSDNACATDCEADYCPIEPPPAPGCNAADCDACLSDDCPWYWCGPAVDACYDEQDCLDYMDCSDPCATIDCLVTCGTTYPTGQTLYYAMLNCLYCSDDACAADCYADYCPIEPPAPAGQPDGSACDADSDCEGGYCICEDAGNCSIEDTTGAWTGGYCTSICELAADACAGDGRCSDLFGDPTYGACLDGCNNDNACRQGDGYTCENNPIGDGRVCLP